jgi:hypothetical protein
VTIEKLLLYLLIKLELKLRPASELRDIANSKKAILDKEREDKIKHEQFRVIRGLLMKARIGSTFAYFSPQNGEAFTEEFISKLQSLGYKVEKTKESNYYVGF